MSAILKFKIIHDKDIANLEDKVNEFISDPDITVIDKQFTVEYNNSSMWKYVTLWYTTTNELKFKNIK